MNYFLAALPILTVLGLMIFLRWSGLRAGAAGWAAGLLIGLLFFGLNWPVLWVSQLKGLFLALFVLAILWPALLLYKIVDLSGGIGAIAHALEEWVGERGLLLILLAWAFSGVLEGLAGFGLPIAIAAPMLVGLGVPAVQAVAAAAVGHAWSVTFGDMSVVFQTLSAITGRPQAELAPLAALFLGAACIGCGLGAAAILKQKRHFPVVIGIGLLMGGVQYGLAITPLVPLAVILAGLAGIAGILVYARLTHARPTPKGVPDKKQNSAMLAGLGSYGLLTALLGLLFMTPGIYDTLKQLTWQMHFPEVVTRTGNLIPAAAGTAFRPLVHPGLYILLVAVLSGAVLVFTKIITPRQIPAALRSTWKSAAPVSAGIIFMVALSSLMDHTGMTYLLAQGLSSAMGSFFPLISPLVGVLGAFATGSNNNSNVLFAPLQNSAAVLLSIDPRILLAAQTSGGALGSMIAPAKIIVGCSTTAILGKDGEVLRQTIPYCIGICLLLGLLAWIIA